jgi:hypothetical protein
MEETAEEVRAFAATFKRFLDDVIEGVPLRKAHFAGLLDSHFGEAAATLPVLGESLELRHHADVQVALDALLAATGRTHELHGVSIEGYAGQELSLSALLSQAAFISGPVEYRNVEIASDATMPCVERGLYCVSEGEERLAVLLSVRSDWRSHVRIEVMARVREQAEHFLGALRTTMRKNSVHRGKVLSLDQNAQHELVVKYRRVPEIQPEQLILPDGLRERIERHTVLFSERSARLASTGRHLKRGILLYGPPGTGKTLTAMYLASRMPGRTVLLLTGRGMGLIEPSCAMARALQPATLIIEDVDLVAEERTRQGNCNTPLLFELLNQMDGVGEDADVLFVLTTNRADLLEPALAARPGRVDQAIEIPLPDGGCRRRLIDLYARGLDLELDDVGNLVARTAGASAAFVRELLRRAALIASDEGSESKVSQRHVDDALRELVVDGGPLTRSLLGATGLNAADATF